MQDGKNTVLIDDVEYDINEMNPKAQVCLQHIRDLDVKLIKTRMEVDQYQISRDAFFGMLKAELEPKQE